MSIKKIFAEIWDFSKTLLFFVAIIMLLRAFIFAPYNVSGESMEPNFHDGEKLIISKLSYEFKDPERFDVVVFHAYEGRDFIKRVIGLPGDKIRYEDDVLYINDKPVTENFITSMKESTEGNYTEDFDMELLRTAEVVPEGHVFVMGDNRPNSEDSRFSNVGFVPYENIVGKVQIRYSPFSQFNFNVGGNKAIN